MTDKIKYLMSAGKVRRFHTEQMLNYQTVADHTYGVLTLLNHFWPQTRVEVWRYVLQHDVVERELGDLPAPAKWHNPRLKEEMDLAEMRVTELRELDWPDIMNWERARVKVCDYLELMCFCHMEMQMGNSYAIDPFFRVIPHIIHFYEEMWSCIGNGALSHPGATYQHEGVLDLILELIDEALTNDRQHGCVYPHQERQGIRELVEAARRRRSIHDARTEVGPYREYRHRFSL